MSIAITSDSLAALIEKARDACAKGPVMNLIIEGRYSFAEFNSPFFETYKSKAMLWQSKVRPAALYMSHGEYIHRYGDGIHYLIRELLDKPTGNRAIISLIDMKDLIGSADEPRPSFLMFQAGRTSEHGGLLYVTSYYRALEVSRFLPINLAETGLMLHQIQMAIPELMQFELCIHAFRAYQDRDFSCLVRCELDSADSAEIEAAVVRKDVRKLHRWLTSKLAAESFIEMDAISLLRGAVDRAGDYPAPLVPALDAAIVELASLAGLRRRGSHLELLADVKERANRHLSDAARILEGMP